MFKPEEIIPLKNKILIGIMNIQKPDLVNLKSSLNKKNIGNIEYIDINKKTLEERINKKRTKIRKEDIELGMISKDWLNKNQNEIPCVIIQLIDITYTIFEKKDPLLISEEIIREMGKTKSSYMTSNYILIIKNIEKSNLEAQIKNNILNNGKNIKDKNIIMIYGNDEFENGIFIENLSGLIKEEINMFFTNKEKSYEQKLDKYKLKKENEYCIKYSIKLFFLSFLAHKENINYSHLFKADSFLKQKLDRNNYKFIFHYENDDTNTNINNKDFIKQILIYLELKNISDYIIYYLVNKKNMSEIEINKFIYQHITLFDINNYLKINTLSELKIDEENKELYIKYLFLFDCIWKLSWFYNKDIIINNKSNEKEENILPFSKINFDNNINNFYFLNNLLRLFNFMNKEKDFIESNIINKYKNYKYKQVNNKFIEKIPSYFELDENDKEKKELNIEENIFLYINLILLKYKDFLDSNLLYNKLQTFFSNQKFNISFFDIITKFKLLDNNNEQNKQIFINNSLDFLNNNKLIKFPKVYENYLENLFTLFVKGNLNDNLIKKHFKTDIIIRYLTISKSQYFSNEDINLINNLINEKNEENKIYNFYSNNNDNNFIDIQIIYKNNDELNDKNIFIKPLDCLNITINIAMKRDDIFLDVEKIQIFFNSEINSSTKNKNNILNNFKEIHISKTISKSNIISTNFNHLIKNMPYHHFFIDNIKIILKNNNIININYIISNSNIILYDKNNLEPKVIQIIKDDNKNKKANKKLQIGEKEHFLYSLKYQKIIENDNIIISEITGEIELKEDIKENIKKEESNEKGNNYYLQPLDIDNKISDYKTTIIYKEDNPINDKEIHCYNFVIRINKLGNYCLFYNLKYKIIHKECPNESYTFEEKEQINIECIPPFIYNTKLESTLLSIDTNSKFSFPTNYPIKFNIFLTNNLDKRILIKKINFEIDCKYIKIDSPLLNIISKKEKCFILSSQDKIIIPNKIFVKENIECSIGLLKIIWTSLDLKEFEQTKELYNESFIELNKINIKGINYNIQGNFIHENNKMNKCILYQLKIKNLNSYSKIIKCQLAKENNNNTDDINRKEIISYGKTFTKEIILPRRELIVLFHFYDVNKSKEKENMLDSGNNNNLIKIDEYNLNENIEKKACGKLINSILFIPEPYSQVNKSY